MGANILIVEDEPLIAFDMEQTVRGAGFNVIGIARNTTDALQRIGHERIDVVILDANLNGQSAAPIAERLRTEGVPFVAVSGYSRRQLGDWLGNSPLLGKPYAADRLIAEIVRLQTPGKPIAEI